MNHSQDIARQRDAIIFLQARDKALLSLCPGYGKCRVSLLALPRDVGHLVIVCPPVVLLHWPVEVKKWRNSLGTIQVIRSAKDELLPNASVTVVSYAVLTNRMKKGGLGMPKPDVVIVDEFHMIKTPFSNFRGRIKGQRTRATLKLFRDARIGYMLSGTPILNRPSELGIPLQAVGVIKVLKNFQATYCAGWQAPWGWVTDGKKPDIKGIKKLLKPIMFRRPASDLKMFTAGRTEPRVLELDLPVNYQEKRFNKFDIEKNPNPVAFEGLSELLLLSGVKKVNLCITHIAAVLEMEKNVVVFCNHTEVAMELATKLRKYGITLITGATKDNAQAAEDYQQGTNRVAVVNTQCGVGVDLFKASYVIFVEAPWNPSILDQCISRCDRVGQTEVVRTDILAVHKSIDAHILHMILTKESIIDSVITTTGVTKMSKSKFSGMDTSLLRVVEFRAEELGLDLDEWVIGAASRGMDKTEEAKPSKVEKAEAAKAAKAEKAKAAKAAKALAKQEQEEEEDDAATIDDARTALKAFMVENGGPAARKILESLGAAKLTDIEDFDALIIALS